MKYLIVLILLFMSCEEKQLECIAPTVINKSAIIATMEFGKPRQEPTRLFTSKWLSYKIVPWSRETIACIEYYGVWAEYSDESGEEIGASITRIIFEVPHTSFEEMSRVEREACFMLEDIVNHSHNNQEILKEGFCQ